MFISSLFNFALKHVSLDKMSWDQSPIEVLLVQLLDCFDGALYCLGLWATEFNPDVARWVLFDVNSFDLAPGLASLFHLILDVHKVGRILLEIHLFGVKHVGREQVLSGLQASFNDFERLLSGQALLLFCLLRRDYLVHAVHISALHELLHQHRSSLRRVDVLATNLIFSSFSFALHVVQLLLQIISVNLHANLLPVHFEAIKQTHRILGLCRLFKLYQDISFRPKSNMITWNLNALDGSMSLEVISYIWFLDVLHLVGVHQSLDANLAIFLLGDEVGLDLFLFIDYLLLGFCSLGSSILGRLWSLDVNGLSHQLLTVTGQSHQNRFWGEELHISKSINKGLRNNWLKQKMRKWEKVFTSSASRYSHWWMWLYWIGIFIKHWLNIILTLLIFQIERPW